VIGQLTRSDDDLNPEFGWAVVHDE